jgi:putative transposase
MSSQPDMLHRRSIHLKGYDYAQSGAYFVTLCAHQRACLFGEIVVGARRAVPDLGTPEMILNGFGNIVVLEWLKTATIHSRIELGEFVVMPNHFHGILILHNDTGTARRAPTMERFGKPIAGTVPTIIRSFKSAVTKCANEIRNTPGVSIWQRNYYEHIIRNDADHSNIAEYIVNNPLRWAEDSLHPDAVGAWRAVPGLSRHVAAIT